MASGSSWPVVSEVSHLAVATLYDGIRQHQVAYRGVAYGQRKDLPSVGDISFKPAIASCMGDARKNTRWQVLGRIGQFGPTHPPLEDDYVASLVHTFAEQEYETLDKLKHSNFQFCVNMGGSGLLILVNLMDAYVLAISYRHASIGVSL